VWRTSRLWWWCCATTRRFNHTEWSEIFTNKRLRHHRCQQFVTQVSQSNKGQVVSTCASHTVTLMSRHLRSHHFRLQECHISVKKGTRPLQASIRLPSNTDVTPGGGWQPAPSWQALTQPLSVSADSTHTRCKYMTGCCNSQTPINHADQPDHSPFRTANTCWQPVCCSSKLASPRKRTPQTRPPNPPTPRPQPQLCPLCPATSTTVHTTGTQAAYPSNQSTHAYTSHLHRAMCAWPQAPCLPHSVNPLARTQPQEQGRPW
jgi:hypothetical protein